MLPKGSCLDQQRALALKRMNLPLDYCSELLLARDYCYRNVNQMSRDTYGSPPTGRDGPNAGDTQIGCSACQDCQGMVCEAAGDAYSAMRRVASSAPEQDQPAPVQIGVYGPGGAAHMQQCC